MQDSSAPAPSQGIPDLAAHYSAIGLALVPISPGTKSPQGPDAVGWQQLLPLAPDEARDRWSGRHRGKGLGCVHEHSGTFVLDIDDVDAARVAFHAIGLDLDELLASGVESRSPRADRRKAWFARPAEVSPAVLAIMWRDEAGMPRKKIIEFRSRGQDVLPPTPYPDGGLYEWVTGDAPSFFPPMPGELVAAMLDWPATKAAMKGADPMAPAPRPVLAPMPRPVDSAASDWDDLRRQIRERIYPSEILRRNGITLDHGGKCSCPFHPPDNNPSFWIFAAQAGGELWNCAHGHAPVGRAGDTGNFVGDAIDLVCYFHNLSIGEATVRLANELGLALPSRADLLDMDYEAFAAASERVSFEVEDVAKMPLPPPGKPLPRHLLEVPGFIGEVMRWNLATAPVPQPVFALAGAIALQSVLAAQKVCDWRGNRTNVYMVCTGDSGCGKSNPQEINTQALMHTGLDKLIGSGEIASDAGLARMVQAQPAILIQIDEFGRTLKSMIDERANHLIGISTALLKLFSCAGSIWLGKVYSHAENNIRVPYPCVSMIGYTVPESLYRAFTPDSMSDGLIARLVVLEADKDMPSQDDSMMTPPPDSITDTVKWWDKYSPGGNLGMTPRKVEGNAEARDRIRGLKALVDAQPKGEQNGGAIWARAVEKAHRFALIYACSEAREEGSTVVTGPAMNWACELIEFTTWRMLELAGDWIASTDFDRLQKRVLRCLKAHGGRASKTTIGRALNDVPKRVREDVLANMRDTKTIELEVEATKGPSKMVYRLIV